MPRFLREVSRCDTGVELLGRLPAPALLTPVGVQAMLHPEAELSLGRSGRVSLCNAPTRPQGIALTGLSSLPALRVI